MGLDGFNERKIEDGTGDRYDSLLSTVQEARDRAVEVFTRNNAQQVVAWIGHRIEAAQYVLNGLQLATQVSEMGGITQASVNASIDSLEAVKAWIQKNCIESPTEIPHDSPQQIPPVLSDETYHAFVGEDESL